MTPNALLASVRNTLTRAADHSPYLYVGNVTGASLTIRGPDASDVAAMMLALPTNKRDGNVGIEYTTADHIADLESNWISYEALEGAMQALASGDIEACLKAQARLQEELDEIGCSNFDWVFS